MTESLHTLELIIFWGRVKEGGTFSRPNDEIAPDCREKPLLTNSASNNAGEAMRKFNSTRR
jgi:hypothetical protein